MSKMLVAPQPGTMPSRRPAALAAARVARAGAMLATTGLASSLFAVSRLIQSWRVTPATTSHEISIVGQKLSYPAANLAAVAVVALAALGVAVTAMTIVGAARELIAAWRFGRAIRDCRPRSLADAWVLPDERPRAFCAGLLRPRIYVSSGAVAVLDEDALHAVLAHERHHARRRDPLRLAAGRVLARALFFIPGLSELVRRQEALAELSADESAVAGAPDSRPALARAMLSFSEESSPDAVVGIDPERVDYLLGEPPSWRFPLALCAGALALIVLLGAAGMLAGQFATGATSLAPPLLSSQPCVVVLAAIPSALGLGAMRLRRRLRSR
jgi:Zn-dependent protease with chaperone function